MKKLAISIVIFLMLSAPVFSSAVLVPCGVTDPLVIAVHPGYDKPCDFTAFMTLINTGITFIFYNMVIPIAAIMFAYAGFLMVSSGGSAESRSKAKSIFTNAVWGLVIAAGAWLIVKTILTFLGYDGAWIFDRFV